MWASRTMRSDWSFTSAAYLRAVSRKGMVCHSPSRFGRGQAAQGIGHGADHRHAQAIDFEDDVGLFGEEPACASTRLDVTMGYFAVCMNLRTCGQP